MAAQRVLLPLAAPSSIVFRFTSSSPSALRSCQHILRTFSSTRSTQQSSKRKMQTSTSYQPYPLESNLPPPARNAGVPDISIAGGLSRPISTRPSKQVQEESATSRATQEDAPVGNPEKDAQKSTPSDSSTQAQAKPRPRFKPRKAVMKLTPGAVEQLKGLLDQPNPKLIKVAVLNKGCSGLQYHLTYVDKPGMLDEQVEQDGVKVIIDSKALLSIIGSEMDWVEDKLEQKFVFSNPNISKSYTPYQFGLELISSRGTMRMRRIFHGVIVQLPSRKWSSFQRSIGIGMAFRTLDTSIGIRLLEMRIYLDSLGTKPLWSVKATNHIISNLPAFDLPLYELKSLELSRSIIHHPHIPNNSIQTLHKRQMRRVLLQIIPPIL